MNEKANLNPTENAGTESSRAPKTTAGKKAESSGFIYPGLLLPFILIVACFAAWGISTDLTAPMVNVFSSVFDMNAFQSALVQFAYFGAYFLLAIPAAIINTKLGFKGGVVLGMSMAALGAFMFFPASQIMTYGVFLAALFILAGGLSIVETSANPYVMSLGPEKNATRRLNFAQAFNPIGANIGVLMATLLVAPHINDTVDKTGLSEDQLLEQTSHELEKVMIPYIILGVLYVALALSIFFVKVPKNKAMEETDFKDVPKGVVGRLWNNGTYRFGVVAQFFNVAAQTCIWTFIPFYIQYTLDADLETAGWWLQISLLFFLVARFVMVWLMGKIEGRYLLTIMCGLGVVFTIIGILSGNVLGALCIVALSACISLLFPTIYGISLTGVGRDTKFASSGLVMAIIGGAIAPMIQGSIQDATNPQIGFSFVLLCFIVIGAFGLYAIKHQKSDDVDEVPAMGKK